MSNTDNTLVRTSEPTAQKGLPTIVQQALYAAILPKLNTCKRFVHYGLSCKGTGKEAELQESLATLNELEAGYLAGNESDLNSLVAMVTLMEPMLPQMEAMLNQQSSSATTTRIVIRQTIPVARHNGSKKGLWDAFLDLDWLP